MTPKPAGERAVAVGSVRTRPLADRIAAHVLGTFEIEVDGRRINDPDWGRRSAERLVKLLLVTPGHAAPREVAAELLWPGKAPAASRANLRKAIHFASRALGDGQVVATPGSRVALDAQHLDLDLDRLEGAFAEISRSPSVGDDGHGGDGYGGGGVAAALDVILELGGRELLPDDVYEDWLVGPRERLRSRWELVALEAAHTARRRGHLDKALAIVDRVIEGDPADEAAHRLAIELLAAQGRHHAVRRQFERCRRALAEALDAEPSEETVETFRSVERAAEQGLGATAAAPELVARARETWTLEALIDRVSGGRMASVSIHGQTGIGKSRLMRLLVEDARLAGWTVIDWQAVEGSAAPSFGPFRMVHAGIVRTADVDGWDEPARSGLATVCPGLGIDPAIPFADRDALLDALVLAIERLARSGPILVAIDDLPWLDDGTTALLQRIVATLDGTRLLLAMTHRDDEPIPSAAAALLDQARRAGGSDLFVESLGPETIGPLIVANLGGVWVQPELAAWVYALGAGNPLFSLELVRSGRERGAVRFAEGRWTMATAPVEDAPVDVPETVRRLVAARTARLSGGPLRLLGTAAELGAGFSYGTLEAAVPDLEGGLVPALDAALDSGLLIERDGGYGFSHPLFRLAVRGTGGAARRAGTHLAIARAMAGCHEDQPAAELLAAAVTCPMVASAADHALAAVELGSTAALQLATALGFTAGGRAVRLFDPAAASILERSVETWRRLPADRAVEYDASAGLVSLAQLRMGRGNDREAEVTFREALDAARNPDELAATYSAYCWMPYRHGDFEGCLALLDEALVRLPPDASGPRATVERWVGWVLGRLHRLDDAIAHLEHSVLVLEEFDRPNAMYALDQLGMMLHAVGRSTEAIERLDRSLALALEFRDLRGECVRLHLGTVLVRCGQPARARPHLERALELIHQMGDRYLEAVAAWAAAEMEDALGRYEAARKLRLRELELLASIGGNPHNEALSHAHLSHLARREGDVSTADSEAEEARRLAVASADPDYVGRIEAALVAERWPDVQAI